MDFLLSAREYSLAHSGSFLNLPFALTLTENDPITREQFAAILHRYAQAVGYDTSASVDLSAYGDVSDVSAWAVSAMQWACGEDIIRGTSSTALEPRGSATRAQAAAMLQRFCERYSQNED